jgi:nucleotide-binding universal stress UspA family protein
LAIFEQIAVGFDEGERGEDALRLGALLARTAGSKLRAVRVDPGHPPDADPEVLERLSREAGSVLGDSAVAVEGVALRADSPARALHELAAGGGADLIVLGSTHRAGLGRVVPGSVAERLLSGAPCPVAIAPRGYEPDELRVLAVGFDGSGEADVALALAAAIGRAADATLRVIAVEEPRASPAAAQVEAIAATHDIPDLQERLHAAVADLDPALRALPVRERGNPAVELVERAEEGVDLLVLGSRGYGPLRAVLLGSVSARAIGEAPCPVLVTPRSAAG